LADCGDDCDMNGVLDVCQYAPYGKGDCNTDGTIDGDDSQTFVNRLFNPPSVGSVEFYLADVTDTFCQLDVDDRDSFVRLLLELACNSCGSPAPGPGGGNAPVMAGGGDDGGAPPPPPPNPARAALFALLAEWQASHPAPDASYLSPEWQTWSASR